MLSDITSYMIAIMCFAIPLGLLIGLIAAIFNSEKLEKIGLTLLLAGGIAALVSFSLCSLGFGPGH